MALPPYIELPGSNTYRYPFPLLTCVSQTFLLPASHDRLQAVTDRWLNSVPGSEWRFEPLIPYVVCNPFWIAEVGWQPAGQGFMRETDFNFGFFVACYRGNEFDHVAYAPAYLIVDNPLTVTTGREIWGWRKVYGEMEYVAGTYEPSAAKTWVSKSYGPRQDVELAEVARIVKPPSWGANSNQASWEDLMEILKITLADAALGVATAIERLLLHLKSQNLNVIHLLQLRSAEDPDVAAYQALIEAPMQITAMHYAWLLPADYRVQLTDYPSYPLISDLGLTVDKNNVATSVLSYQLNFDAVLQGGKVLAKASKRDAQITSVAPAFVRERQVGDEVTEGLERVAVLEHQGDNTGSQLQRQRATGYVDLLVRSEERDRWIAADGGKRAKKPRGFPPLSKFPDRRFLRFFCGYFRSGRPRQR